MPLSPEALFYLRRNINKGPGGLALQTTTLCDSSSCCPLSLKGSLSIRVIIKISAPFRHELGMKRKNKVIIFFPHHEGENIEERDFGACLITNPFDPFSIFLYGRI